MNQIIEIQKLKGEYAYLDDLTVCRKDQKEHDTNLRKFLEALTKYGLVIHKEKNKFNQASINLFEHLVPHNFIPPDPDRLKSLVTLPVPNEQASSKRGLGFFTHYSKWTHRFSDRIRSLTQAKSFTLLLEAV